MDPSAVVNRPNTTSPAVFQQLEQASKNVEKCLQRDNCAPALVDQLNVLNGASFSGMAEYDYPTLGGLPSTQLRLHRKVPMPPEILEHFNHMQCHCTMGLLPAIGRAYLTIDTDIYLWQYDSGADVAYYDGLPDTIVSVGLVTPRAGVFQPFIRHLLILTTATDIVVLGMAITKVEDRAGMDEIQLVPEPVFSLPTDGSIVLKITGTQTGRLFYGTKDGNLYEIVYQGTPSWFGKRCKKINHSSGTLSFFVPSFINAALTEEDAIAQIEVDNTSHVLYVLTEKGSIEVYDMGAQGTSLSRVARMTVGAISQRAMAIVKTLDSQIFKPIVSIAPIDLTESNFVHLVAVTQSGVRLYFSTYRQPRTPLQLPSRPYTLELAHVRLPPGYSGNLSIPRPLAVHVALHRDRCMLLATRSASASAASANTSASSAIGNSVLANVTTGGVDTDTIWCIGADLWPFCVGYMAEAYTTLRVDGAVLAAAEVDVEVDVQAQPTSFKPPMIVRQHSQPNRRYVILTATGAHILTKLRPVDLLRQLLIESRGMDSDAIRAYFQLQGDDEACASCVILARDDNGDGEDVMDQATRSFFLFGGEPKPPGACPIPGGNEPGIPGSVGGPGISGMISPAPGMSGGQIIQQQNRDAFNQTTLYPGQQSMFMPNIISTPLSAHQQQQQAQYANVPHMSYNPNYSLNPTLPQNPNLSLNPNINATLVAPNANLSMNPNLSMTNPNMSLNSNMSINPNLPQSPYSTMVPYGPYGSQITWGILDTMSVRFSAKHNGLYYNLTRILRPMWNLCCVDRTTIDGKTFYMISSLTIDECAAITSHLTALRSFLQRNTQLSICPNPNLNTSMAGQNKNSNAIQNIANTTATFPYQNSMSVQRTSFQDAQLEERQSLDALKMIVNHCCEIVGLWRILCEHQFHLLLATLPDANQLQLQNSAFKDLFLYGTEMCQSLINSLINSYLCDNASVSSISAKLRDVCPTLYKTEDAAYSKANEMLKQAESLQSVDEKEDCLREALHLCTNVSPNINLPEVCQKFTSLGAYNAVVELCCACAKKCDPDNIAEHFYKNLDQVERDGYPFYLKRMEIYKEIAIMLTAIYHKDLALITNISGQDKAQTTTPNTMTLEFILTLLSTTSDHLMHISVYEWMMQWPHMQQELVRIKEPSLETYLLKAVATGSGASSTQPLITSAGTSTATAATIGPSSANSGPTNIPVLDLLWKYYETNRNHHGAAKVLAQLANTTGSNLTLSKRLEYLGRAIICMQSENVGYAPYLGQFLRNLEDSQAVAKVQMLVLNAIQNLRSSHPNKDDAITLLNSGLFEVTQLYEDFADRFELWECKLAIINCAGYSDDGLVLEIWQHIIKDELKRSCGSANDKIMHVLSKIKGLAKLYQTNKNCFPLHGIILELEYNAAQLKADTSLVPNFCVSLDISVEKLIETYNHIVTTVIGDLFWSLEENEFHFSKCIATLVSAFLYTHEKYSNVEKRRMVSLCQDTVAGLLSYLYSKPGTEQLVKVLRDNQVKLQRL